MLLHLQELRIKYQFLDTLIESAKCHFLEAFLDKLVRVIRTKCRATDQEIMHLVHFYRQAFLACQRGLMSVILLTLRLLEGLLTLLRTKDLLRLHLDQMDQRQDHSCLHQASTIEIQLDLMALMIF